MKVCDWVNLPDGIPTESLWCSLHNAELLAYYSDLMDRNIFLTFQIPHLPKFHNLPADLRFVFRLDGVQSARILRWEVWPGPLQLEAGMTSERVNVLKAEHRAKWREHSGSWDDFQQSLFRAEKPPVVSAAMLADGRAQLAIKLGLNTHEGEYIELIMRAEGLRVFRTDGEQIDLKQLNRLGEAYWDSLSADRRTD